MPKMLTLPAFSFEYAYSNYASQLYGMIFTVIQSEIVSHKILEEVFARTDYDKMDKKTARNIFVCKTRQLISGYIKNNPAAFTHHHRYIGNSPEISNDQLLELIYTGRYTITEINELTGIDEDTLKQKIVSAVKNKVRQPIKNVTNNL